MKGTRQGKAKKVVRGWTANTAKFAIKWWLENFNSEEFDKDESWDKLKGAIFSHENVGVLTRDLQTKWIDSIDPLLDTNYFELPPPDKLPTRDDLGFSKSFSLHQKLKILGTRVRYLFDRLDGINPLFQVEPRRIQSKLTFSAIGVGAERNTGAATQAEYAAPSASRSCITSNPNTATLFASWTRRPLTDTPPTCNLPVKRCSLQWDIPTEFESNEEGARCTNLEGFTLPKQIFKDKNFFLLQDTTTYVGKAIYKRQMHLVLLHGGKVIQDPLGMPLGTLFVVPESGNWTSAFDGPFYLASLIEGHIERQQSPDDESLKKYVWRDNKSDTRGLGVKLEKPKKVRNVQNQRKVVVVDLTLDEEDEKVEKTPLKLEPPEDSKNDNDNVPSIQEPTSQAVPAAEPIKKLETEQQGKMDTSNKKDAAIESILNDPILEAYSFQNRSTSSKVESSVACSSPVEWTEKEKQRVHALVFQCSKNDLSAAQVCQEAASKFEEATKKGILPETISSRFEALIKDGTCHQLYKSLKEEYQLTENMWITFKNCFLTKPCPFRLADNRESDNGLKGIAAIDDFITKKP